MAMLACPLHNVQLPEYCFHTYGYLLLQSWCRLPHFKNCWFLCCVLLCPAQIKTFNISLVVRGTTSETGRHEDPATSSSSGGRTGSGGGTGSSEEVR
jgi:hypothetical protein